MLDHPRAFWVPIVAPKGLVLAQNSPILGGKSPEVGENDLWARRRPQRLQVTLKHFTGVIIHDYKL